MVKRLLPLAVLLAAAPAYSQHGPGMMEHGPGGPFRTPVTNAPYSATFTNTSTEKLQDGTVLNHSSTRTVTRDSLGRTREEMTLPARSGDATGQPHTMITIFDPVARTMIQLHTQDKTATVRTLRQPGADAHQPPAPSAGDTNQAAGPHGRHEDKNVVKADLGSKTLNGVIATGTRVTRTIPAGTMGNAAPIVSTHEDWFSPDLKVELSRTDVDPFHGNHSEVVTTLSRTEPDASLFKVPDGYTVKQAPDRAFGRRGPGAPNGQPPMADVPPPPPGL